ncbi:phage regulatory CII family protein [Marinomonas transparens]|uniref:Phage regulatory CII family protein n=1 Tax=Marinomonas transparens TaxID=2795388 RepID=A0A934JTB6_9GAMM|nr:phage regulatory CII family protein [Marinomonas transparens]MBJ7536990.1 phage regulatory CII family protein [Marinomonas transparens]
MTMQPAIDHFTQAVYDLVHKSEMSSTEIATTLGMSPQILINKVNPHNTVNKLTVHELHAATILTGNDVVIRAMQAEFVLSVLKNAPPSILEAMISQGKEIGDVFAAVQEALADNHLSERERSKILKEIREAISSLEVLMQAVVAHGRV